MNALNMSEKSKDENFERPSEIPENCDCLDGPLKYLEKYQK